MSWRSLASGIAGLLLLSACKGATVDAVSADSGASDAASESNIDPDTGAADWSLVYQDPNAAPDDALQAMSASSENDVWAVGTNRQIVHFDGKNWDALVQAPGAHLYGVWGASPTEVVAAGTNAFDLSPAVYNFDGNIWTSGAPFPSSVTGFTDVWGIGSQRYYTGLLGHIFQDDPVVHPTDRYHTAVITGGCPNQTDPSPNLNGIDASDLDNILAVGNSALIAHKDAVGWARFCGPDTNINYASVFRVPGTQYFYVGSNHLGILLWLSRSEPLVQIYENFALPDADQSYVQGLSGDAQRLFGVGDHGKILYLKNGADAAVELSTPTTDSLYGVAWIPPNTLYVCGKKNRIWRRTAPFP